jgi:hypothetical protein
MQRMPVMIEGQVDRSVARANAQNRHIVDVVVADAVVIEVNALPGPSGSLRRAIPSRPEL